MQIQYYGQSSFILKGKNVSMVIDPYSDKIGRKFPKLSDIDIVLTTHQHIDHNDTSNISEGFFLIDGPGEYDIKNISIEGIFSYHDNKKGKEKGTNTIYIIDIEGIRICHLGDLGTILDDTILEKLGNIDILMVPVGGKYTIDAKEASKVISQIEPFVSIPMHYSLNFNKSLELDSVDVFLKEMGITLEPLKTLKFNKEDFSDESEGSKIILMDIS